MRKNNRGITLLALVITIILLLILASISLSSIMGFGIFGQAKDAKKQAEELEREKGSILEDYDNKTKELGKNTRDPWRDNGDGTFTKGDVTVKIGDYVNYTTANSDAEYVSPTGTAQANYFQANSIVYRGSGHNTEQSFVAKNYFYGWRVLGVEDGKLKLISAKSVASSSYGLKGLTGVRWGPTELNNIGAIYGTGEYAISGRCINVEDVNKVTGYDPSNTGTGKKYEEGTEGEYGNIAAYKWGTSQGTITCKMSNGLGVTNSTAYVSNYKNYGFNFIKGNSYGSSDMSWINTNIAELTASYYQYYPTTLTTSETGEILGVDKSSTIYSLLFEQSCWLADSYTKLGLTNAFFGIRTLNNTTGSASTTSSIHGYNLYNSAAGLNEALYPIRVIVILDEKSDIDDEYIKYYDGSSGAKALRLKWAD